MCRTSHCLLLLLLVCKIYLYFPLTHALTNEDLCSDETNLEVPIEPLNIPFNDTCNIQVYNYSIIAPEDSSIIQILVTSNPLNDTLEEENDSFREITVKLLDRNKVKSHTWTILPNKSFKDIYYSKSSHVKISFEITGNWSGHNVTLTTKEIPFKTFYKNSSEDEFKIIRPWYSEEGRLYRPNSVFIFRISEDESLSNIMITLDYLDIDEEEGEYLLIGPGSEPFESSPPVFISSNSISKKYLINDNAAYIVFVTRSTTSSRKGFQASREYTGEQIEKPKVIEQDGIRQSVPICIFNITAVENEFQTNKAVNWFIDFRRELANIASEFIKRQRNSIVENTETISESSVSIFEISKIIEVNESCQYLYAMVKIYKEPGKESAFTRQELETIVDSYIQSYAQNKDKFQFDKCPPLHRKTNWAKIGLYLIIPVVFCLFLFAWTWKYNPVTEYFARKRGMKRLSQHHQQTFNKYYETGNTSNENAYTTGPEIQVTNDEGYGYTLNPSNTLLDGELSDDEVFNRERPEHINERRQAMMILQGNVNHGFELGERCSEDTETNVKEVEMEQKSDHVYESVISSSVQMDEEVMDTRL